MTKVVKTYSGNLYVILDDKTVLRKEETVEMTGKLTLVGPEPQIDGFVIAKDETGEMLRSSRIVKIFEVPE